MNPTQHAKSRFSVGEIVDAALASPAPRARPPSPPASDDLARASLQWHAAPPASEIRFAIRQPKLDEITGRAARWRASFLLDPIAPTRSTVAAVIDAGSLETGAVERDNHARSAEFLDITRYPEITFRSREVHGADDSSSFTVTGDLTIRDVTREVTLEVERHGLPGHGGAAGWAALPAELTFTVRTSVHRSDFGLRWHREVEGGDPVAGDRIDLEMEITARRFQSGAR